MPRFYFNLANGTEFAEDEEGVLLPDIAAAHARAVESLRDVMAGDVMMGDLNTASFIEVEDEQHNLSFIVSFEEAVRMRVEGHEAQSARGDGPDEPD